MQMFLYESVKVEPTTFIFEIYRNFKKNFVIREDYYFIVSVFLLLLHNVCPVVLNLIIGTVFQIIFLSTELHVIITFELFKIYLQK